VYWPFWNEPAVTRPVSAVRFEAVPYPAEVLPRHLQAARLQLDVVPPDGIAFVNALRVDVAGQPAETDPQTVNDLVGRLLRLLRDRTRQWWVGHPHREAESRYVRASFPVDARGEMVGTSTNAGVDIEPRFGDEAHLTPALFTAVCAALGAGEDAPLSAELFHDARYFAIRGDIRRSVLDAVIACDFVVLEEALRLGQQRGMSERQVRGKLSDRDLLANLRRDVPAMFGASYSFAEACPGPYQHIVRLWAARGSIAHGRLPHTGTLGRGSMPTRAEQAEILGSVGALLTWFRALPPHH
jgi:hypothetical protein